MTAEARNLAISFAREKGQSLVCTIDSVGTGVNMQNIATVGIVHALSWEPNKLLQMEGRPHRIDTHEPFQWIYLAVRESADEHVINTVVSKIQTWQDVMGMSEGDKGLKDALSDSKALEINVMQEIFNSMEINYED
jgi:SNF2 family DNA or RNA helicase